MLVLSRRKNESVILGDGTIKFMILEIKGDKVRIGIDAPKDVTVHREEIYKEILKERS